jgi:two-component sensor histidine kinase
VTRPVPRFEDSRRARADETTNAGHGTASDMSFIGLVAPGPFAQAVAGLRRIPGAAYLGAVLLVLASLAVRALLDPIIATGYGFILFYPAVILSAYWLGGRPAMLATGLSASIVYVFMGPTPFRPHLHAPALVWLAVFLISSGLLIHVLSSIRARFNDLVASHARVEALATGQAELFREHAQRTTDHLQLISAILQARARGEADPTVSRVLANAASRTLVISRTHRAFVGDEGRTIHFEGFARRLADAAAVRDGLPAGRVQFSGGDVAVPVEQATALGLVLLEYLTTLGLLRPGASLAVTLDEDAQTRTLNLTAVGAADIPPPQDMMLVEAMTEQLGGRLRITRGREGCDVRIAFPAALQPPPSWDPLTFSLH